MLEPTEFLISTHQYDTRYISRAKLILKHPIFKRLVAPHFDEQTEGGVPSTLLLLRILGFVALCLKCLSILPTLA